MISVRPVIRYNVARDNERNTVYTMQCDNLFRPMASGYYSIILYTCCRVEFLAGDVVLRRLILTNHEIHRIGEHIRE